MNVTIGTPLDYMTTKTKADSQSTQAILDESQSRLIGYPSSVAETVADLSGKLRDIKYGQTTAEWESTIKECLAHPVRALLHEDPLTERAFTKPRGYQGDAQLLDIIYRRDWREICQRPVTSLGQAIFDFTILCKAPNAVRIRRDMLAEMIDDTCERVRAPHILSVACGHLRELAQSAAMRSGGVGRFVGLDQDPESLAAVKAELESGVEVARGSVRNLLSGPLTNEKFDFIYAAGLYDYLEDRLAQRLTERMFAMLRPGGHLLVANYLPDIEDVGFMEAYMGWHLTYRDKAAIGRLADSVSQPLIASQRIFNDASNTIGFLELKRI